MDREKLIDTKNAIKESYDILEKKLEDTNSLLDKRVQDVDDLSKKLNSSYSTMDRVEYELKQATGDLQTRAIAVEGLEKDLQNERECLQKHRNELMHIHDLN